MSQRDSIQKTIDFLNTRPKSADRDEALAAQASLLSWVNQPIGYVEHSENSAYSIHFEEDFELLVDPGDTMLIYGGLNQGEADVLLDQPVGNASLAEDAQPHQQRTAEFLIAQHVNRLITLLTMNLPTQMLGAQVQVKVQQTGNVVLSLFRADSQVENVVPPGDLGANLAAMIKLMNTPVQSDPEEELDA